MVRRSGELSGLVISPETQPRRRSRRGPSVGMPLLTYLPSAGAIGPDLLRA